MVASFLIVLGVVTYQEVRYCHDLPWPPRLVATGMVFLFLDLFGAVAPELAGVMAIGMVLAMIINTLQLKNMPNVGLGQFAYGIAGKGFFQPSSCIHNESTSQPSTTSFDVQNAPSALYGPGNPPPGQGGNQVFAT